MLPRTIFIQDFLPDNPAPIQQILVRLLSVNRLLGPDPVRVVLVGAASRLRIDNPVQLPTRPRQARPIVILDRVPDRVIDILRYNPQAQF